MTLQAGDCGFHRDKGFIPMVIHLCEARKHGKAHGPDDPAWWNHTFMARDALSLIEATNKGVVVSPVSEYQSNVRWFRPPFGPLEDVAAVTEMESLVGTKYSDLSIVSDALYLLFRTTLRFKFAGKVTCSGAVSQALELGGVNLGTDTAWNSPADVFAIASKWPEVFA